MIPNDGLDVARVAHCNVTTYGRPGSGADWIFEVAARSSGGRAVLDIARRGERVLSLETRDGGLMAKVWLMNVGRVRLYLLDCDVEGNSPQDRDLT